MASRKGAKATSSRSARRSNRFSKGNGPLLDLPLDVLFEILKLVHPLGLLQLSRTNKVVRDYLLEKSTAQPIWRTSLELAEEAPPQCPSHTSEVTWTHILFDEVCHVCLQPLEHDFSFDPIWWEFGARYCSECISSTVIKRLPTQLTRPGNRTPNAIDWSMVLPRCNGYYLRKDIKDIQEKYLAPNATTEDKEALIRQFRQRMEVGLDLEKIGSTWMQNVMQVRSAAMEKTRQLRWDFVAEKLKEEGWSANRVQGYMYRVANNGLLTSLKPITDEDWNTARAEFIAEFEKIARLPVWSYRCSQFRTAFPSLSQLTENTVIVPQSVDVLLLPEVRAIIEENIKVELTIADIQAALTPLLPRLITDWSRSLEARVRAHTSKALNLPPNGPDPLAHPLAYFVCDNHCCYGYFAQRRKPCHNNRYPWGYYNKPETYEECVIDSCCRCKPTTPETMFNLEPGRALLAEVITKFGKDPDVVTREEMDKAPGKLYCMRCTEANQPERWSDAPAHAIKFHQKVSSLKPRWEVDQDTSDVL